MNAFRRLAATLALAATFAPPVIAADAVTLTHVHGLAYSSDGERLMIPSHHGLAVFSDGKWSKAPGPEHDYMGFAATADAFYSSGHPAQGSGMVNPFGVIRSNDGGRTWDSLGMSGETDFHLLAASHRTNAIYVFNPAPNSRMKSTGLYVTLNDGLSWKRRAMDGIAGAPTSLAVHPERPDVVAVGTESGVFLAEGESGFRPLRQGQVTALWFDLDDATLWVGSHDGSPALSRVDTESAREEPVALPALERDAVAYIAQNPERPREYAIASFRRNVFVSTDAGKSWREIARDGRGIGQDG